MATLPLLRPTVYISGTLVNTTAVANVNDNSDTTFIESVSGNGVDGQWIYNFASVPTDFASMDSNQVTLTIRCRLSATGDDTWRVRGELTDNAGNAISNVPAYVNLANNTNVQQFTFLLTKTGANTAAAWNDARMLLDYQNVKNMAADGNVIRITDAWLSGTYTVAAPRDVSSGSGGIVTVTGAGSGTKQVSEGSGGIVTVTGAGAGSRGLSGGSGGALEVVGAGAGTKGLLGGSGGAVTTTGAGSGTAVHTGEPEPEELYLTPLVAIGGNILMVSEFTREDGDLQFIARKSRDGGVTVP